MTEPDKAVMNPSISDPVTRAVVDNIMGNLPTKKPHVRCQDCDLSFTSQTVLDAHLQGARHAKQVKSNAIMASLQDTKIGFTQDEETNGLRCNVCNVSLNSIQQLQTHVNGNRHKKKAVEGGWDIGKSTVSKNLTTLTPQKKTGCTTFQSCDICNKLFNSQGQYDEHVISKRHLAKLNGTKPPGQNRFTPYKKKPKARGGHHAGGYIQSLSNNFIPGGYEHYS